MIDEFIERRIAIGAVVSSEYLRSLSMIYQSRFIDSVPIKTVVGWCLNYYEKYKRAPGKDIEGIYTTNLSQLPEDRAERIERILGSLSEEFEREEKFNVEYLLDQTEKYFKSQHLKQCAEAVQEALERGELLEAEHEVVGYKPVSLHMSSAVDIFDDPEGELVRKTFKDSDKPLVKFPGDLGVFWNEELTRDAFVALLGPEKRGKSYWLMEIMFRAARSKANVVFFQAGDLTEKQQMRRMYTYVARRSWKEKHCGELLVPVMDCVYNQLDTCDKDVRECDFGPFREYDLEQLKTLEIEKYIEAIKEYDDYKPCTVCRKLGGGFKGAVWYKVRKPVKPLTPALAYKEVEKKMKVYGKRMKVLTYPSGTLKVSQIEQHLDLLEKLEDFVADVVVIDYADILQPERGGEYRHQQNQIWRDLRSLSQSRCCLVVTATQADSRSYDKKGVLTMSNFSEDKRKLGHVTAMYGLNQTVEEKRKGLMRLNKLVIREDEFTVLDQVTVLQCLQIGRPCIGSFF